MFSYCMQIPKYRNFDCLPGRTSPFMAQPGSSQRLDSLSQSHSAERQLIVVKWERMKGAKLAFSTWNKCYPQ